MNSESKILNLGCGNKKSSSTIGVDFNARTKPDIVHNLDLFPYPFEESSIDKIYIDNTLEHLDSPLNVMNELYRIIKPNGVVKVIVPYFRSVSAFTDPTHLHFFTVESFSYYDPDHIFFKRYDYTLSKFKTENIIFHEGLNSGLVKSSIVKFANKWPLIYERFFSNIVALDEITFYLRCLK